MIKRWLSQPFAHNNSHGLQNFHLEFNRLPSFKNAFDLKKKKQNKTKQDKNNFHTFKYIFASLYKNTSWNDVPDKVRYDILYLCFKTAATLIVK